LLFVVIRRDGTLRERAGIAYTNLLLSSEGQRLVERAGFVAMR
jgi:phosphate transport system substrate-binding protein